MRAMLFVSVTNKYLTKVCEFRYSHSNFWTIRDMAFIFHMYIPCDKAFQFIPKLFTLVISTEHQNTVGIMDQEKKNEIWLSPMTKTLIPTENSSTNWQHKNVTKLQYQSRGWQHWLHSSNGETRSRGHEWEWIKLSGFMCIEQLGL